MSVTVLWTSEWTVEKPPMQARRESLRRAVMGKTSSAQDGITSSKVTAAPCLPSTKLPCAQLR